MVVQQLRLRAPNHRAWVQSPVGELKSHTLQGVAENLKHTHTIYISYRVRQTVISAMEKSETGREDRELRL